MLKNGDWECVVMNDPEDIEKLSVDIQHKGETVMFIRQRGSEKIVTVYESKSIPFDWFFEAMQIAKDRLG
jgi:hypothetical protein